MRYSSSMWTIAVGFALLVLLSPPVYGQEIPPDDEDRELQTEFMMLNQHVCPYENMEEVMEMVEELIAPVFDEMQADGEISDWGILTHAWGDEYNFNFFFVTEDHRAFLDAFDTFVERSTERDPDWADRWTPLCTMHKDNLYQLHRYGEPDNDQ